MTNIQMLGNYSPNDGTIEFYNRIKNALCAKSKVIDLGAGRGAWWLEETTDAKRAARSIRPICSEYIGVDVDPAVLSNPATHRNLLIENGVLPVESNYADFVISDYVFEHIKDVSNFSKEIDRVLKPGGVLAARTPHYMNYVAIASRLTRGPLYNWLLKKAQPERKDEDCFPTYYRLNTMRQLVRNFRNYENFSYLYVADPAYDFGNPFLRNILQFFHRISPPAITGNLFVFMRKPSYDPSQQG